jgi:ABC-type amino acid transport substrate-binding protein
MQLDSMKLGRRTVVVGLVSIGCASVKAGNPRRVLRALVESWPPYLYSGDHGRVQGLDAELLEAICREAGFEVHWVRAPMAWRKRRYKELLNDQFDVIFSATPVAFNANLVMYTRTYRRETMMVAALAPHPPILDSLRNFDDVLKERIRLLHVDASGLGKEFDAIRPRLANAGLLIPYPTTKQGIEMLRIGRASLILGDALDLQEQSRAAGLRLIRQAYGYSEEPVSLMLSRRRLSEIDLDDLNRAIVDLEQRGVLGAIRNRYLIAPERN